MVVGGGSGGRRETDVRQRTQIAAAVNITIRVILLIPGRILYKLKLYKKRTRLSRAV